MRRIVYNKLRKRGEEGKSSPQSSQRSLGGNGNIRGFFWEEEEKPKQIKEVWKRRSVRTHPKNLGWAPSG
jgi:hypothetical protein